MSTPANAPAAASRWQLGDWLIEPAHNRLRPLPAADALLQDTRDERTLEPRVMAVLELLLRHSHASGGEPISDELLLAEVWPGIAVSDASVYQAIAQLRKALGDNGKPYRYVGRVSGKGYVLLQAPVPLPVESKLAESISVESKSVESKSVESKSVESKSVESMSVEPLSGATANAADAVTATHSADQPARATTKRWPWVLPAVAIVTAAVWWALRAPPPPAQSTAPAKPVVAGANPGTYSGTEGSSGTEASAKPDSPGWDDYLQGRWLWQQRKPEALAQAATHFRTAIGNDPQLALAYVGLCDVFHFQHLYGDWPLSKVLAQCEPLLREALQREPELGAALASFGLLKLTQNELDAADTFLDRALAREPNNAMAWLWSGQIRQRRGDFAAATERMQRAATLDPLSAIVKRSQSHLLMNTGDFIGAQQAFEEALLREPDYADRPLDEIEMRPLTIDRVYSMGQALSRSQRGQQPRTWCRRTNQSGDGLLVPARSTQCRCRTQPSRSRCAAAPVCATDPRRLAAGQRQTRSSLCLVATARRTIATESVLPASGAVATS